MWNWCWMSRETDCWSWRGSLALQPGVSQQLFEKVQEIMGVIGWFRSLLSGMLVRFWSHQQRFMFPWEPAEESWCVQRHGWAQGKPAPGLCRGDSSKGDHGVCLTWGDHDVSLGHKQVGQRQRLDWGPAGNLLTAACLLPNPESSSYREPCER